MTDWDELVTTIAGISAGCLTEWNQELEIAKKHLSDVPDIRLYIAYTKSEQLWAARVAIHGKGIVDKHSLYLSSLCSHLLALDIAENLKAILLSMYIELDEEGL